MFEEKITTTLCYSKLISISPPTHTATLSTVMNLDNPVNVSSPAIRTDYTGYKAKGERLGLYKKTSLFSSLVIHYGGKWPYWILLSYIQNSSLSVVSLVRTSPAYLRSSGDSVRS